ncbi:hypothetical protein ACFWIO_34955 [Streptomyces diastatochromogenes]|uniref:hypothetical protein n=1 Tax=Streptomyces diastatochromogenes TaxID=42236 RepID=UPI00364D0BF9
MNQTDPTAALRAVLTVTVETRPDGGHYFDQADFTGHVTQWVRAALKGKHAIDEVTITEQPATAPAVVSPPTTRAAVLLAAADLLEAWQPEFSERWAVAERQRYEDGVDAAADRLRRLAAETQQQEQAGKRQQPDTETPTHPAVGWPLIKGNCPACRHASLFLGTGGYPTCSNYECPEPDAATTVLEQYANEAHAPEHSWAAELYDPLADEWVPGTRYPVRDRAVNALDHAKRLGPTWKDGTPVERRLVRATTTYTVEEPAPVVQQPAADDYDRSAWETYRRDAGCACTSPDPSTCAVNHRSGPWLCVCHRLSVQLSAEERARLFPEQQPAAAHGEETLPPPQGPEYTPCACDHIEPDHDINGRWCSREGCECALYRPTPPAPLRRSEDDCPGFPERCPNLRPVDPNPPVHYGGIRCGCADTP